MSVLWDFDWIASFSVVLVIVSIIIVFAWLVTLLTSRIWAEDVQIASSAHMQGTVKDSLMRKAA